MIRHLFDPYVSHFIMSYSVKELFYTLQGEGANAGKAAVFCRFSGCNLWSGREQDRSQSACPFCDTDFVGICGTHGGKYPNAAALATAIDHLWPAPHPTKKLVVCTGGEPLLQLDPALIDALHTAGFTIAVETNGTLAAPHGIDWLCVSPKAGTRLQQTTGDELKVVYPQPLDWDYLAKLPFTHHFIQACDDPAHPEYQMAAVTFCLQNPHWRLSVQTHKYLRIR